MKNRITIGLGILAGLLIVCSIMVYLSTDNTPPKISLSALKIEYHEGDDMTPLTEGVYAMDDKDGDISDRIRVYDISPMEGGTQALVTYAAYDNSYNLGKGTRVVDYYPALPEAEQEPEKEVTDTEETAVTEQPLNGVLISGDAEDAEDNEDTDQSDEDEGADDDQDNTTVSAAPTVVLKTHELKLAVGEGFYSMDCIETASDDVDSIEYLYSNMYMDGAYDINTPGTYEVRFYCYDSDHNLSNIETMNIVVGD